MSIRSASDREQPYLIYGEVGLLTSVSLLLYPAYYCIVNGAIALLIHQRRRALRGSATRTAPGAWSRTEPTVHAGV